MGSPVGWCRTEWQAELAGPMVFSLHRALLGTRFQPSLLPALTFTFPLLPAPLPARNECGGNLAKDCEKMKTFLKWHVPVVSAGRQSPGAAGPDPCLSPKYPKYVPSLAAKPQQCPPYPPPPPSDPGSARRPACRKGPEAPALPREGPWPAWRSPGGPRAGAGRRRHVPPRLPTARARPAIPRAALPGACVRSRGRAGQPPPLPAGAQAGRWAPSLPGPLPALTLRAASWRVTSSLGRCRAMRTWRKRFGDLPLAAGCRGGTPTGSARPWTRAGRVRAHLGRPRAQRATHALSDARGDLRDVTGACDVAPNVPRGRIYTDRHDQRSALTRRGLAGVAPETRSGRALGWGTARPCPST